MTVSNVKQVAGSTNGGAVPPSDAGVAHECSMLKGSSCDMDEEQDAGLRTQRGQVTVGHLLLFIAFFILVETVIIEMRHLGGGPVQYALGVPLGLGLGAVIVRLNWISGRSVWLRSQRYSKKVQNRIAIGVFVLDIVWMIVGGIAGSTVAHLLIRSRH